MKSLNIKDPEVHHLAAAISRVTGESMTYVVREALRERLKHLQAQQEKASVEELLGIAKRASAQVNGPYLDHAAFLYDENGLPK
jgi:antitoxin VapB